ncbi:hypothetical protein [Affinirhizobium pseudoryzae]|uniref:hypothetical protein n=1 Tax=Allorhizobium pseudoryzae TaxID=379684 RepID=UPI0013EAE770|nr:hypothetical protein [Allorhizobium pseudoryzae]
MIRITRFTNEGGGAAGDGVTRSGEIGRLVGDFADWFVDFARFLITTLAECECEPRFRFWLWWLILVLVLTADCGLFFDN